MKLKTEIEHKEKRNLPGHMQDERGFLLDLDVSQECYRLV